MKGRVTTKASAPAKWIPFLCVFCFALGILFSNRSTPSLHASFSSLQFSTFYFCFSFYLPSNLVHELHRACVCADYGIPQLNPTVNSSYRSVDMNKNCKSSMTIPQLTRFYFIILFYRKPSKLVCPSF